MRNAGLDSKWVELSKLLQDTRRMFDAERAAAQAGASSPSTATRSNYLVDQIGNLLGKRGRVVTIHGGMGREERRIAQSTFTEQAMRWCCWRPTPPAKASTSSGRT